MSVVVDCTRRQSGRKAPVAQPFAALPHHIACDPRLSPVDVRVLSALLYYARAKPDCWPCDASAALTSYGASGKNRDIEGRRFFSNGPTKG